MLSKIVIGFLDRQRWLDGAGDVLAQVASATFDHLGPLSKPIEDLLHGTPAGHPLHPAFTDIPIGAWTATLALDIAGLEEGADLALDLGLAGAAASAIAGLADWRYTEGTQRRTGVAHALLNVTGTALYALSSLQRHKGGRAGATTLSNIGYGFILGGGFLGGELAYQLGVMVNRNAWVTGQGRYVPVMPVEDLEENKPVHAEAGNEEVVLVKRGGSVYALAESCAHLGGPLSEGTIEGDAIVCPWHGSQFALEDGSVVAGPSAYNQPCYAARIRNSMVEVRLGGEYAEREPYYRVKGKSSEE
jgi:nitrite reductase/ring-hydroxylating ferredoxin subunit/uncharacterized membrane protein